MAARRLRHTGHFTIEELVARLLPSLGWEKSTELVESTIRQLGLSPDELDDTAAMDVFRALSQQEGLAGAAARFVRMRLEQETKRISSVPVKVERPPHSAPQPRLADTSIAKSKLVEKFASSLGSEKALALVDAAAEVVGASGDHLSPAKALELVEYLAKNEGLVGVVARFAKAQLLLRVQKQ